MRTNNRFLHIINNKKPVLVDFHADWCQPCKQIQPVIKELKETLKHNIRILKVNVDDNTYIAKTHQIKSIPTLILFIGGEIKWRGEGIYGVVELTNIIKEYIQDI